jgi:uncharacterized protein
MVDRAGRTRLHYAALENDASLVAGLISGGADVNAADKQGFTPLHSACQVGALAAARQLLDAGATVDSVTVSGMTPLYLAVVGGNGELVSLLRESGADPLIATEQGGTPLELARRLANSRMAQYFEDVPEVSLSPAVPKSVKPETVHRTPDAARMTDAGEHSWQGEYQRLWDELVPSRGQASTVQGELVRCVGRLTDEAYLNGNQNWSTGSGHDRMLAYIERILLSDIGFDAQRGATIKRDVRRARDLEHPDTEGEDTCYRRMKEAVVDWCMRHPEPIPRESDPDLHM